MSTSVAEANAKIRRTLGIEFVEMEDDFDKTRFLRNEIIDKVMSDVSNIKLTDEKGDLTEDADVKIRVVQTALKALSDVETAKTKAITLKLKNREQEMANATLTKDRIAIVIQATAPGAIENTLPMDSLDQDLNDLFKDDIKPFELKGNPNDLEE